MEPDPVGNAVLGRLVVGEVHLGLGDGDTVDLAAEGGAGHDAGAATARAGVEQAVLGPDLVQVASMGGIRGDDQCAALLTEH
jgi:hypothetical protein